MPKLFRKMRHNFAALGHMRNYLWYAVGEVVLIFFGITLALAFSDMQESRRLRVEEISILRDIAQNLQANVKYIEKTIERDGQYLKRCQDAIIIVEEKSPPQPGYGSAFEGCRFWTSPYLSSAAYSSLKVKGTDLISNPDVRSTIVNLYEEVYAYNVGDIDREQWSFQSSVLLPLWNRYFRTIKGRPGEASDYGSLLDSTEFLNMLYNRSDLLDRSINTQVRSLAITKEALAAIDTELLNIATD